MSRAKKLLKRFLSKPSDFTFDELKTLLASLGYEIGKSGATSGSRVAFVNPKTKHIIRIHKPHPESVLKFYQMIQIINELKDRNVL